MLWFLRRQQRDNTLSNANWHYAVFLFGFFYASRFLNENYLGYILAFLAIGLLSDQNRNELADRLMFRCRKVITADIHVITKTSHPRFRSLSFATVVPIRG